MQQDKYIDDTHTHRRLSNLQYSICANRRLVFRINHSVHSYFPSQRRLPDKYIEKVACFYQDIDEVSPHEFNMEYDELHCGTNHPGASEP